MYASHFNVAVYFVEVFRAIARAKLRQRPLRAISSWLPSMRPVPPRFFASLPSLLKIPFAFSPQRKANRRYRLAQPFHHPLVLRRHIFDSGLFLARLHPDTDAQRILTRPA